MEGLSFQLQRCLQANCKAKRFNRPHPLESPNRDIAPEALCQNYINYTLTIGSNASIKA